MRHVTCKCKKVLPMQRCSIHSKYHLRQAEKIFFGYILGLFFFSFFTISILQNSRVSGNAPIDQVSCGFFALGLTVAPQKQTETEGVVKRSGAAKSQHFPRVALKLCIIVTLRRSASACGATGRSYKCTRTGTVNRAGSPRAT